MCTLLLLNLKIIIKFVYKVDYTIFSVNFCYFTFYKRTHVAQAGVKLTMDHLELLILLDLSPKDWN